MFQGWFINIYFKRRFKEFGLIKLNSVCFFSLTVSLHLCLTYSTDSNSLKNNKYSTCFKHWKHKTSDQNVVFLPLFHLKPTWACILNWWLFDYLHANHLLMKNTCRLILTMLINTQLICNTTLSGLQWRWVVVILCLEIFFHKENFQHLNTYHNIKLIKLN